MECLVISSGSEKHTPLHVPCIIEYLQFSPSKEQALICADFVVQNKTEKTESFRFLHRGNVHLSNRSKEWDSDLQYTPLFQRYILRPQEILIRDTGSFHRVDTPVSRDQFVPFSLYEGEVPPQKVSLVRATGEISGDHYMKMTDPMFSYRQQGDRPFSQYIRLSGGNLVLFEVERDFASSQTTPSYDRDYYQQLFFEFRKGYDFYCPGEYHLFIDTLTEEGWHLQCNPTTPDLYSGEKISLGKRRIAHFWSRAFVFRRDSKLKGLEMSLHVETAITDTLAGRSGNFFKRVIEKVFHKIER